MLRFLHAHLSRLHRDDRGTQLVEFTILMPTLLLVFAVIIEGGRLMWSYQSVAVGVRDASRYLSRAIPSDICDSGGSVAGWSGTVTTIVRQNLDGEAIFPVGITVDAVTPTLICAGAGAGYRVDNVGVVQVRADLTVTFPFAPLFQFAGQNLTTINTSVTDQSRVFGT